MTLLIDKRTLKQILIMILLLTAFSIVCGIIGGKWLGKKLEEEQLLKQQRIESTINRIDSLDKQVKELQEGINDLINENNSLKLKLEEKEKEVSDAATLNVEVTAYDLSVQSCGKSTSHPEYGVTATGTSLAGHTLESARAIAVDPNVIALGSKVELSFTDPTMHKYNGIYTAVDTGGAIKGNRIDLFFGDFGSNHVSQKTMNFGRREARATIV